MASSEWLLGVQIKHSENPYNVEIFAGRYCCCDYHALCDESITDLDGKCLFSAVSFCDTYFLVHVQDSSDNQTCSVPKTERFRFDNSSTLDQLILHIPLMETGLSNEVRGKSVQNQLFAQSVNLLNSVILLRYTNRKFSF